MAFIFSSPSSPTPHRIKVSLYFLYRPFVYMCMHTLPLFVHHALCEDESSVAFVSYMHTGMRMHMDLD